MASPENNQNNNTGAEKEYILNDEQKSVLMNFIDQNITDIVNNVFRSFKNEYKEQALEISYTLVYDSIYTRYQELLPHTDELLMTSLKSNEKKRSSDIFPKILDSKIDYHLRFLTQPMRNISAASHATQEICENLEIYQKGSVLSRAEIQKIDKEPLITAMNELEFDLTGRNSLINEKNYQRFFDNYSDENIIKLGEKINWIDRAKAVFKFNANVLDHFMDQFHELSNTPNLGSDTPNMKPNPIKSKVDKLISDNFQYARADRNNQIAANRSSVGPAQ